MAYTDDWESLMNGVFGAGGKLKFGGAQPQPEKPQPEKPAGSGLPDLNAALLEQQKQLDELLKQQNARLKAQDAGVQTALEDSRQMLRDMEADGLLAKGTADTKPEQLGSFEGLAAEVKKTVLGQDAFVDSVVRAMRRPFVLGTEGAAARNVILLWGAPGTGRHFALAETARIMAARGLLQSDRMAVMDLALYPDPGAEKLFLQDLYAALHAPGEIVVFEHYESCHPGFLRILSDLAVKGSAPLSSRYLVNKEGILVEAGTALAPGAVSRIDPCGKYLIFFSRKGREALADKFGASFVAAVGDVCQTAPFTPEALAASTPEVIFEYIRSVSYPNNKAKHLVGMAKMLVKDFNSEVPGTLEELVKLPGVGRKTANVIQSVVFNKAAMAVDTHVFRVSHRLGLVSDQCTTPFSVEKELVKNIPEADIPIAHHWLILHGRYVCQARTPQCDNCGLQLMCKYYCEKYKVSKEKPKDKE